MAKQILGRVAMVNRGEWESGQTYDMLDIVAHNGSSYTPNKDGVSSEPPSGDWTLIAARGNDGQPGEAATIKVGSVTTGQPGTQASVSNSGDEHNAILNFVIPSGFDEVKDEDILALKTLDEVIFGGVTKTVSGKSGSGNIQSKAASYEINIADTDTVSVSVSEVNLGGGTLTGYQVRKISDSSEVITSKSNSFEFSTNSPSGFTIRMFVMNPSSDFSAKFTVRLKRKTAYDEVQDKEILELKALDEVIFGETNHRWENFGSYEIIGFNPSISRIRDSSGNYNTPPIEISGGRICSVSVIEDGGSTEHLAYCVHTDSNNNKGKTLDVIDCYFESNSGPCVGVGTRVNYEINFRNCVFNSVGNSVCVYLHNTSRQSGDNPSTDNKSKISFVNCTFISHDANCLNLQDWKGDTDFCEFTFINCKFVHPVEKQAIFLDYRNYSDTDSTKWHNKFSLSTMSSLNSDDLANFS